MPFRDRCAHCMMGRGRTHQGVRTCRGDQQPSTFIFSSPTLRSVTCVAVKEDRHQNIVSSVVLKKGIEEPWASERVARFIISLGYKEITLESDTERAIIAFRNRVGGNCNAEVTLEDPVKGASLQTGFVKNAVMLLRGVLRTIKCPVESCTQEELREDSPILPWLVEHAGSILSRCQNGRDGRSPFERLHGKKLTQEFVPLGDKVLARPIFSELLSGMNPRCKFGVWLGVVNNSAKCFVETAEGGFRVREVSRIEHQDRWDKEAINNVIGVPQRIPEFKNRLLKALRHKIDPTTSAI